MVSLNEYLENNMNSNLDINNSLDLHFYAESVLHSSFRRSFFVINEKHGSYIGQKELIIDLSKRVWMNIDNNEPESTIIIDKDELLQYNTIFFEQLIIMLNNDKKTMYAANKSKFDISTQLFDKVVIMLSYDELNSYHDVCSAIMHEMLHAFNHYKSCATNNKRSLDYLYDKSYSKTIMGDLEDVSVENICKRILNNIRQWEQNAYINELTIELYNSNFDISNFKTTRDAYKAAKNIFVNSSAYIQYISLKNVLNNVINKNDSFKEEFKNTYNSVNDTNLSYEKILKKLNNAFDKIMHKIERLIPKLFYDYYIEQLNKSLIESEGLMFGRQSFAMIEYINFYSDYMLQESTKSKNDKNWEIYVDDKLDSNLCETAKNWKKQPSIGQGMYCDRTVFKIIDIKDNKVYTKSE